MTFDGRLACFSGRLCHPLNAQSDIEARLDAVDDLLARPSLRKVLERERRVVSLTPFARVTCVDSYFDDWFASTLQALTTMLSSLADLERLLSRLRVSQQTTGSASGIDVVPPRSGLFRSV